MSRLLTLPGQYVTGSSAVLRDSSFHSVELHDWRGVVAIAQLLGSLNLKRIEMLRMR